MPRLAIGSGALSVGLYLLASAAMAEMLTFNTDLNAQNGVPPNDSAATGTAEVTVDTDAMTVSWTVEHTGLTGEPTAAHFHGPAAAGENAGPVVDISANLAEGSTAITAEQLQQLQSGMWYLNVHTAQYPDGEIRGQVEAAQ